MSKTHPKRVAIYARVSKRDSDQNPENQLKQLREWCNQSGHTIVREYVETESGQKGTGGRKVFAELFEDAGKRQFDLVLFWALDRFSREGMTKTVMHLERLDSYGVCFHSYQEPLLSTENELVRDILLATFSALAKMEAERISERVKAGLERAKERGTKLGRPSFSLSQKQYEAVAEEVAKGTSIRKISEAVGIPKSTLAPIVADIKRRMAKVPMLD